jgi:bilirubin oxidase
MQRITKKLGVLILLLSTILIGNAQNPLFIPPTITGPVFDLNVQSGSMNIYPGNATPTYGINGSFLSPTIVVNKGDVVTLNVNNGLPVPTTMHWHGLHVAPVNDGGPHQIIPAGTTWSPSFEILNNAGTFWYHPHGEGKTELHVLKGLSGMFLIHDPAELALGLPLTYGVDDFPLIVQSRAFDALNQVAMASHMDTSLMVNGTLDPILDVPAQIIRMRLLNGSSMRTFNFGFSNGMTFQQIATDGGLMAAPNALNRILLAPGERAEILVDLYTMQGQNFDLMSYSSEMALGIFGSPYVGIVGQDTIMGYSENPLNGADFPLLHLNVVAQSTSPVTTIPTSLVPYTPYNPVNVDVNRVIVLDTLRALPIDVPNLAEGPFGINESRFDMSVVNIEIPLNSTEIWTLKNNTHIAHPFHIHDILFNVIEKNGDPTPPEELGWKDVVLVMPHDSVKFITKFTDFTDPMVPYMYHCHLLHHEDDGMMGSFLVQDPSQGIDETAGSASFNVYPNPALNEWTVQLKNYDGNYKLELSTLTGSKILDQKGSCKNSNSSVVVPCEKILPGIYLLRITTEKGSHEVRVLKTIN